MRTREYKEVNKEEFDKFITAYPNPLDKDVTGICDPPMLSYNDFTLGNWPESVVAKVQLWEGDGRGIPRLDKYWILDT